MGLFDGWSLKNPLQPITHAAGKAVGVTANTHNGIHVDPSKLVTDAMAATGNPAAIAALAGNFASAADPNSWLDTAGRVTSDVGNAAAMFTGGATNALKAAGKVVGAVPGVGSVESALGNIPGASKVASGLSSLFGLGSGTPTTSGPIVDPAGAGGTGGWQDPTGGFGAIPGVGSSAGSAPAGAGGSSVWDRVGSLFGVQPGQMSPADKVKMLESGLGAVGGAVSGYLNQKNTAADQAERAREFNVSAGPGLLRAASDAPLRDRALARLSSYTSQAPAPFTPHDFTTEQFSGPGSTGGYDAGKLASDAARYTPGAGGVNANAYQQLLKMAGLSA